MYSREELDQIEAEWAFQLSGRMAFLGVEDFRALMRCQDLGIPASQIMKALQPDSEPRQMGPGTLAVILDRLTQAIEAGGQNPR